MKTQAPAIAASRALLLGGLLTSSLCTAAVASDWPQYRGVRGDGIGDETGLAHGWGEAGPSKVWTRSIGEGFSGLAVSGDRLYTLEDRDGEQRIVALDSRTGNPLWSVRLGTDYPDPNGIGNGPRSTPTIDGRTVYTVSSDAVLFALATEDGALRWRSDFKQQFGAAPPRFGYAASPVVVGDLLVVEVGGPDGKSIVAFDKAAGEVRWASLDDPASYTTPLVVTLGGRQQLVFNRRSGLVALAVDDGELLWQHPSAPDTIVMPIFVPPDRFFISSATMGDGGHMIRVRHGEGGFSVAPDWSNPLFRNHFNNSVAVGGYLYGFDNATFRCVDVESGEARWAHRGYGKGSVVAAGDLLFVLSDRGLLALVEATPEAFRELGRVQATEGRSWTSPTLADGRLYVRDSDEIVAFDVRRGGAAALADSAPESKPGKAKLDTAKTDTAAPVASPSAAAEMVDRYVAARGGAERWEHLKALELKGTYSAFSQTHEFTELHQRFAGGERFRLDFETLGGATTWARDEEGWWWIFPLLGASAPARIVEPMGLSYLPQLERRALLEPPLLHWRENGIRVKLLGPDKVADRDAVALEVTLGEGQVETWYLDPTTWLEVAVDSTVYDFSQATEPMAQRAFFSDFRSVDGLMLPYQVSLEFGARLEEIRVDRVSLDPVIDASVFRMPPVEGTNR